MKVIGIASDAKRALADSTGAAFAASGVGIARRVVVGDGNAMLLSLRAMREFTIHPQRAEATLSGGVQWVDMVDAAQDHGLAPLLGSAPHTGALGYTLGGGGSGWLARPHGLAVDQVRSLTVVLADGSVVTATPDTEPDLFWALCGAGTGGLGVVVKMTVGLASVSEVYAGNLLYPPEAAADVFGFWRDWTATLRRK